MFMARSEYGELKLPSAQCLLTARRSWNQVRRSSDFVKLQLINLSTFSPEGRLFQVEYSLEAIKLGSTAIGVRLTSITS
jgi:hypothetical protein